MRVYCRSALVQRGGSCSSRIHHITSHHSDPCFHLNMAGRGLTQISLDKLCILWCQGKLLSSRAFHCKRVSMTSDASRSSLSSSLTERSQKTLEAFITISNIFAG